MDGPNVRSTILKYSFNDGENRFKNEIYYEANVDGELQTSYHLSIDEYGCNIIKKTYRAIDKNNTDVYDQFEKEEEIVIERLGNVKI